VLEKIKIIFYFNDFALPIFYLFFVNQIFLFFCHCNTISMNINLSEIKVTDLLPQAPPFLFVDKIIDFNYETYACKTSFLIKEECFFTEEGKLTEAGILENIAQTCAAQIGFVNTYILKKEIQIGFIGAVKNLKIDTFAAVDDLLETTIEIVTNLPI